MNIEMKKTGAKPKNSIAGVVLSSVAVVLELAALLLLRFDDAGLWYVAVFPLAGVFGAIGFGMLPFKKPIVGWAVLTGLFFLLFPFACGVLSWWFITSGVEGMFLFALPLVVLITLGWLVGLFASKIAEKKPNLPYNKRFMRTIGLIIAFFVVLMPILLVCDLCFGNPITAAVAGSQMRDWLEKQENANDYEILDGYFPSYDWYNTKYTFDLAGGGKRWVLHWNEGKIRLDNAGW